MSSLSDIKSALEEYRNANNVIAQLNSKLQQLRAKADTLETRAINLINKAGYKGRPLRLDGYRYTVVDSDNRAGISQKVVKQGLERWLKSVGRPASDIEAIMTAINNERVITKVPSIKVEKAPAST
jgi:hypothetical protein